MKNDFVISGIETGKLNALVKNIMFQSGINDPIKAVRMVNSGQLRVSKLSRKWKEENGIISFCVTLDNTTGPEWVTLFGKRNFHIGENAKSILNSPFRSTGGLKINMAIIKSRSLEKKFVTTREILSEAQRFNLLKPNIETTCLVCDMFSADDIEDMGLSCFIFMHEPVGDSPDILSLNFGNDNSCNLGTCCNDLNSKWGSDFGFVFIAP